MSEKKKHIKIHNVYYVFFVGHNSVQHNFYHAPPADRQGIPALSIATDVNDTLGPLPQKWEKAYTENGESYFIE